MTLARLPHYCVNEAPLFLPRQLDKTMSAISHSITWRSWSQKWGDWTTWFPKLDLPQQRSRRGLVLSTGASNSANADYNQLSRAVAAGTAISLREANTK